MVVQTRPYQERIGPRLLAERSASLQSSSGVANSSPLNTHSRRTCVPPRPFQERERPFPKQASPIQQRLQASSSDFRALGTRYRPPVAVPWPSVPTSGPWALGFRPPVAIPWPSVPFQAPHSLTATPGSSLLLACQEFWRFDKVTHPVRTIVLHLHSPPPVGRRQWAAGRVSTRMQVKNRPTSC